MDSSLVTIAIVPRERFGCAAKSLESVIAHTPNHVPILYVDGNAPRHVAESIDAICSTRKAKVLRTKYFLSPNVARNLAIEHVRTKYVVFVDNDIIVSPDWLEPLIACAESNDAAAVGPILCDSELNWPSVRIKSAGGNANFYDQNGNRFFRHAWLSEGLTLESQRPTLSSGPVDMLAYAAMLVRMDVFDRVGGLDESYLSMFDDIDLSILLRGHGLKMFIEPRSAVAQIGPLPLNESDREFFALRWCEAWNRLSVDHFQSKWDVDTSDPGLQQSLAWATEHRCAAQSRWGSLLQPLGKQRARRILVACDTVLNRTWYRSDLCMPGKMFSGGAARQLKRTTKVSAA